MSELFKPLTGAPLIASVAAATPAGAVANASAALGSLPPALADITAGTVIAGVVVERGRGMVVLKTDKGLLPLQTNLALKLGAAVVLEVQSVGAQVRLAIISVDQHEPTALAREALPLETTALAAAFEHDETTAPTPGNRAAAPSLVGRTLTATVVGPPDPHAAGSTGEETIPTLLRRLIAISTVVRAAADTRTAIADEDSAAARSDVPPRSRIERAQPPVISSEATAEHDAGVKPIAIPSTEELEAALKTLPTPARDIIAALLDDGAFEMPSQTDTKDITEGPAAAADRAATSRAPSTEPAPTPVTPKSVAIRILAQAPATGGVPLPPRGQIAPRGDTITLVGTVIPDDGAGTDITTPIGRLRLPLPAPLPQGTRITFEVLARAEAQRSASPEAAADTVARMIEAERDWSAVRDVAVRWPEAADTLLPKAGQPLGPATLAFLAAVRGGGNLKAWLGERFAAAADAPQKKDMIERLGQDLAVQARAATAPHPPGWQTIAVPVIDAGRVSELRFRFRKRGQRDGKTDDEDRRFVVEAKLSAIGPLQIDGTVRKRHLDLVVRTAKALPPPMRRDIVELFARSLAETSYRGEIHFRNDASGDTVPHVPGHSSGVVV